MGSASSFFRSSAPSQRNQNTGTIAVNHGDTYYEQPPSHLPDTINIAQTPQQQSTQVHNHVVSTSDGRISSQRLRIETPRDVTEFHETPRTGGVVVSSGKFTPRQDADTHADNEHKLSIPYTPNGPEAETYKYYCPLCMQYYKFMWKTACCTNYICLPCTQDYLKAKGIPNFNKHVEAHRLQHVSCPHCQTNGFVPVMVEEEELVRDYRYSHEPVSSSIMPSPLKIGESFEDLKRKMIPYKVLSTVPTNGQSVHASPVLQVIAAESAGQFEPAESQGFMRGIAIPEAAEDDIPPSPSINRNAVSLFGETPRHTSSLSANASVPPSSQTPRQIDRSSEFGNGDAFYSQHDTAGIDRITSSIQVQATPVMKSHHQRGDDEMSETMDALEESFESLVFPRLQDQNTINSPVSISEASPDYQSKLPRSLAVGFVQGAIDTAFQRHISSSQ